MAGIDKRMDEIKEMIRPRKDPRKVIDRMEPELRDRVLVRMYYIQLLMVLLMSILEYSEVGKTSTVSNSCPYSLHARLPSLRTGVQSLDPMWESW